ncbi:hypothetical protein RN22_17425 [Grimontia sp. AD028]|uniref:hypothetical protein n=1 Tax=Grimontia sp. AD028 TaxID=1581149 RepID=UPI00061B1545|nr:hypothetical protein [Grimontia sp. AD028]KKD59176.1 hypothetical protein RN22_17425 [Grimontia sp. AD028]
MSLAAKVYNQLRLSISIMGPCFLSVGLYTFFNPESEVVRNGEVLNGSERIESSVFFIAMGTAFILARLFIFRYRRNPDFTNDIPLPTIVYFEKTNSVNENIRRYKEAQKGAVDKRKM